MIQLQARRDHHPNGGALRKRAILLLASCLCTTAAGAEPSGAPDFLHSMRFMALCAGAGVALLYLLYLWRVRQITARVRAQLKARQLERERIARALHDTLLQGVQSLTLRFQTAVDQLPPDSPSRAAMEQILDSADQIVVAGRDQVMDLRVSMEAGGDLADNLSAAACEIGQHSAGVRFAMRIEGAARPIQALVTDDIYCVGREALSNAFRHAQATLVELVLDYGPRHFTLRVRDDGIGIGADTLHAGGRVGHWGLAGMRERAQGLGGLLDIRSGDRGRGTEIVFSVPAACAYGDGHPLRRWLQRLLPQRA